MYKYEVLQSKEYKQLTICENNSWNCNVSSIEVINDILLNNTIRRIELNYSDKNKGVSIHYDTDDGISNTFNQTLFDVSTPSNDYENLGVIQSDQMLMVGDNIVLNDGRRFEIDKFEYRMNNKEYPVAAILAGINSIRVDTNNDDIIKNNMIVIEEYCKQYLTKMSQSDPFDKTLVFVAKKA